MLVGVHQEEKRLIANNTANAGGYAKLRSRIRIWETLAIIGAIAVLSAAIGLQAAGAADAGQSHWLKLSDRARDAIVVVATELETEKSVIVGTGFFITADGHFVTNHHVLSRRNEGKVVIRSVRGNSYALKAVVAESLEADLCVGVVERPWYEELPHLLLNHAAPTRGDVLTAVGFPRAEVGPPKRIAIAGAVGSVNGCKVQKMHNRAFQRLVCPGDYSFILCQIPVRLGMSGGPLFNDRSEVVGVNSMGGPTNGGLIASATQNVLRMQLPDGKTVGDFLQHETIAVVNRMSGKALDLSATDTLRNGTFCEQHDNRGSKTQLWKALPAEAGWVQIVSRRTWKALGVDPSKVQSNGEPIRHWDYLRETSQQWKFKHVDGEWCKIVNRQSGKVMEVPIADIKIERARIRQADYTGAENQQWKLVTIREGLPGKSKKNSRRSP